jgi:pimeloyl-ACP methyl ester carboxylesterase
VREIAFDRVGSGEPLVLIHGLGSRRRAWDPVVELIAGEREVLNLDLPGFGDSAPDPAGTKLTVADHVDRVEELIDGQGFERPHVAGNSLGGGIALELGRRGGARTVTAFSPVGFWGRAGQSWCRLALRAGWEAGQRLPEAPSPRFELALTRLGLFIPSFGRPFKVSAEEVRATREAGLQAPGFLDALDYGLDYRFGRADDLRGLPVTVAWGRRDVLLLYWTQSRAARRALPLARHITLPRCGHVPFHDDPQLCARVVLDGSRDGVA